MIHFNLYFNMSEKKIHNMLKNYLIYFATYVLSYLRPRHTRFHLLITLHTNVCIKCIFQLLIVILFNNID